MSDGILFANMVRIDQYLKNKFYRFRADNNPDAEFIGYELDYSEMDNINFKVYYCNWTIEFIDNWTYTIEYFEVPFVDVETYLENYYNGDK